ncbi:MAG TPA: amidohydrolase family protein, partial [Stellaceae bacterium]|nr:amidohydrolase family protein [Stellaceae bacterium]
MARILLTNVKVFDGTGAASYPGEVLVEGNRIEAVRKAGQPPLERGGAEMVDGGGATLMPGMVES